MTRTRAYFGWAAVSAIMILHFFIMLSVGVLSRTLRFELGLTAFELSLLASSYLYLYILMQTPLGILLDLFGAKRLLTAGAAISAVGSLLFACSNGLILAIIARLIIGLGMSFVFIIAIRLAEQWFGSRYLSLMVGLSESASVLGAIFGNMTLAALLQSFGWRQVYVIMAAALALLTLMCWRYIEDKEEKHRTAEQTKELLITDVRLLTRDLVELLAQRKLWYHGLYMSFSYAVVTVFSGLWAIPFMRKTHGFNLEQATLTSSALLIGFGIGCPLIGFLAKTSRQRLHAMLQSAMLLLVTILAVLYINNLSEVAILVLMFSIGLASSGSILSFSVVAELVPSHLKSSSIGFINTLSLVASVAFQPLIGGMLNLLSDTYYAEGIESYSAQDYRIALAVIPLTVLVAIYLGYKLIRAEHKSSQITNNIATPNANR